MASVPDAPAAATTTNVTMAWSPAAFDGSAPVLAYRIKLKGADGVFREEATHCGGLGADQATILSARTCIIPMTSMTNASSFNLTEGTLIVAAVEALNTIGYSTPSAENTAGALVQVVPASPPTAPSRGSNTNTAQLEVIYAAVAATGGSPVLSYRLELDRGAGAGFEVVDDSLINTFTITATILSG